jgi:hypothetical protein
MREIKLSRDRLIELGLYISETLTKTNVTDECTLEINVDKKSFQKIDEDIFFRENNHEEYHPSEDKIVLRFNNLFIHINKV